MTKAKKTLALLLCVAMPAALVVNAFSLSARENEMSSKAGKQEFHKERYHEA